MANSGDMRRLKTAAPAPRSQGESAGGSSQRNRLDGRLRALLVDRRYSHAYQGSQRSSSAPA
jgi:hypothetical protein